MGLLGLSSEARDVWIRRAICSRACRWPIIRAFDQIGQFQDRLDLVLDHPADGDPRPVLHHGGHGLLVGGGQDQGRFALQLVQLGLQGLEFFEQRRALVGGQRLASVAARARRRLHGSDGGRGIGRLFQLAGGAFDLAQIAAEPGAEAEHFFHQFAFARPAGLQPLEPLAFVGQFRRRRGLPRGGVDADRRFPLDDLQFGFQGFDPPAAVVHFGRHGMLADGDPRRPYPAD